MGKILCYVYDGMADFEVTLTLHRLKNNGKREIVSIGESLDILKGQSGLNFRADCLISDITDLSDVEALIIPGGPVNNEQNAICPLIREMISRNLLVSAICFAPQFLGRAGILSEYKFTTSCSASHIQKLGIEDPYDRNNYIYDRCIVDRNVITAQGYAFVDFADAICDYLGVKK